MDFEACHCDLTVSPVMSMKFDSCHYTVSSYYILFDDDIDLSMETGHMSFIKYCILTYTTIFTYGRDFIDELDICNKLARPYCTVNLLGEKNVIQIVKTLQLHTMLAFIYIYAIMNQLILLLDEHLVTD